MLEEERLQPVRSEGLPRFVLGFDQAVGEEEQGVAFLHRQAALLESASGKKAERPARRLQTLQSPRGPEQELRVVPGIQVPQPAPGFQHGDEQGQVGGAGRLALQLPVQAVGQAREVPLQGQPGAKGGL